MLGLVCDNCSNVSLRPEVDIERRQGRAVRSGIPGSEAKTMTDFLNFGTLICASVGSMAFGVLAAYGVLWAGFALLRPQARRKAVEAKVEVARAVTE